MATKTFKTRGRASGKRSLMGAMLRQIAEERGGQETTIVYARPGSWREATYRPRDVTPRPAVEAERKAENGR